jgi:single-stranded DNA-binding protein
MINQLVLIGKIREMENIENNELVIEVRRNYKNTEGVFEKDYFKCNLWIALSKKIGLNCKNGDLVAVKGRLVDDKGTCNILAEQVILLNKTC